MTFSVLKSSSPSARSQEQLEGRGGQEWAVGTGGEETYLSKAFPLAFGGAALREGGGWVC